MTTVGSLFSGIGGIDLGLERAGMKVIWQSEIEPYASRVLAKHWPEVPNLGDVTKVDWDDMERPDLVAGGFPCQPVSQAGRRLAQADDRWLWPEYARAVRHLRPDHVLVENVPGLLVRGVADVLGDLAELGYDTEWASIPAAVVGAPHLRWRVFLVAHAHGGCVRRDRPDGGDGREVPPQGEQRVLCRSGGSQAAVADPGSRRGPDDELRPGRDLSGLRCEDVEDTPGRRGERGRVGPGTPEGGWALGLPPGPSDDSRRWWESEPDVGRVAHGVSARVDRLRCLGNAVVPQVVEFVGRCLAAHIDGSGCD